ncbi:MAG: copper resistance CopC family protein [Actinomycetota bacterium]
MNTSSARRPVLPLALAGTLLTALLMLMSASPASAHDTLLESSPAADATVETLPDDLTLTFSADLISGDGATAVVVTDAGGETVSDGEPTVNGTVVTQPLVAEGEAGVYDVVWKVVSSDGHPISGEFSFTVETGTVTEEPTPTPSAAPTTSPSETVAPAETASPAESPDMTAESSISAPWIIAGAAAVLIAAFLTVVFIRRRRRSGTASDSDAPTEG